MLVCMNERGLRVRDVRDNSASIVCMIGRGLRVRDASVHE